MWYYHYEVIIMLKKAISLVMVSLLLITQGGCDMANIKTLYGSDKLREAYPKVNENFNAVNGEVNDLRGRVNNIITTPIDGEAAAQELIDARGEHSTLGERLDEFDSHMAENATIKSDLTITVGSGGDYPTINAALESLYTRYPQYKQNGIRVEIKLLSGFVMAEQVLIEGIDLGFVTITSEDMQVTISREALTIPFNLIHEPSMTAYPAFGGRGNATLPIIDVLFYMDVTGSGSERHGFFVSDNSELLIKPGKGCRNAGGNGLYAINGSRAIAYEGVFDSSISTGVRCFRGSFISIRRANVSNCGACGIYLGSTSEVEAREANFSNAGEHGIWIYGGGKINASYADISGCAGDAIHATQGSTVVAIEADLSGAGECGIRAANSSKVEAREATIQTAGTKGVYAETLSEVNVTLATITDCTQEGIYALGASRINAQSATITGCGGIGAVTSERGSTVNVNSATINNNAGYGLFANRGGNINADEADCSNNNHASYDIRVSRGSIVSAYNTQGRLSITENTITADGIIFK
jgi:hypothetical protein